MIERSIKCAFTLLILMVAYGGGAQTVLLGDESSEVERFAAQELKRYLAAMGVAKSAPVFELGETADNRLLAVAHLDQSCDESYLIQVKSDIVRLVGRSDRATLYSVYHFLETQGCRFFGPDPLDEVVPTLDSLDLELGVKVFRPAIGTREIGGGPPPGIARIDAVDWRAKNRLNRAFALRPQLGESSDEKAALHQGWLKRGGTRQWHWIAHNFGFMFPEEERWFERHPEYFALYEGRRRKPGSQGKPYYGGGNLALTNEQVITHVADFATNWFEENPRGEVVPLWPNDGAIYWDESPKAMALGGKNFTQGAEGSMTRRMVVFANKVAERVGKTHDASRLLLLPAYANYIEPLPDVQLHPNIMVQYCFHGDYAHGPLQSPVNAKAVERMRKWSSQAEHFGVWEYFLIGDIHEVKPVPVLLPLVYRVRDTMRFLEEIETTHYFTQANPVYQSYNPLVFYATARYAWDPSLDADALIADYCLSSFGPAAAEPMTAFYLEMERACYDSDWRPTTYAEVATPSPKVFSPKLLKRLSQLLKQARDAEMTEKQSARYERVVEAFEATRGAVRVSSVVDLSSEQPWRIQRLADAYVVNPEGKPIDPKRFKMLVQQAIDTGGGGPTLQRTAFRLPRRVEPIVRLEQGPLELDVLPGLGGRAIRLVDQRTGWNYFSEGAINDSLPNVGARYFNYGGYETYIGRGFAGPGWEQAFDVVDQSENQITLLARSEEWSLKRTYRLDGVPPSLLIEETLQNEATTKQTMSLRTHPQLTLGADQGEVQLYQGGGSNNGSMKRVDVLMGLHDQATDLPASEVMHAVWQPATKRGLKWETLSDARDGAVQSYVFLPKDRSYFQLERFGPTLELEPGQRYTISQRVTPIFVSPVDLVAQPVEGEQPKPIEGKVASWVAGPDSRGEGSKAGAFDADNRVLINGLNPRTDQGTIAFWLRPTAEENTVGWALSVGNNIDGWFAITADRKQLGFLAKLGKAPYQKPGEAYVSLSTTWAEDIAPDEWRHVVVSWRLDKESNQGVLVLAVNGKVVERREGLRWPASFPSGPVVVGGNSAAVKSAGKIELCDMVLIDRFASDQVIAKLSRSGKEQPDQRWQLSLDESLELEVDDE